MHDYIKAAAAAALCAALAAPAWAGNGNGNLAGNGFPKGPHHTLKLLGKGAGFKCGAMPTDDGEPQYGNVIFMPRVVPEGGVTIGFVEGGVPDDDDAGELKLGVLDRCTEPFLDSGETVADGALVSIPPNANGYAVYARLTGKPGAPNGKSKGKGKKKGANKGKKKGQQNTAAGSDTLVINGDLLVFTDPNTGEALALLGTVDESGVLTPTGDFDTGEKVLIRTDPAVPGNGVVKAMSLEGLFTFTGSICKPGATADDPFCATTTPEEPVCEAYCCVSTSPDGGTTAPDATIDSCSPLASVGVDPNTDGDGNPETGDGLQCPLNDAANVYTPTQCKHYVGASVFDIQSIAQYLWNLSGGAYNVQLRFYPR